jgi:hypothetical protein
MRDAIAPDSKSGRETTTWSLCWQAAVGRDFLAHPSLPGRIRERLIGAHQRPGRVLFDYVLLPTEIHAVAQVRAGDSVVGIARAFGNVLSRWVRQVKPIRSPVLAGPYRAVPILSADELRDEIRMLAWRPVILGRSKTPTHYPHGGLRIASGLTPSRGFDARPLLQLFGESVPEARAALRRWARRRPSAQDWRAWELTRGLELATGTVGPHLTVARAVNGAAATLIAAGGGYGIDGALAVLETWVVAKILSADALDLKAASGTTAARGRAMVAGLAVTHRLCSAASVARYFGRAKATLSEQMAASRKRPADRAILGTPLGRILEEAGPLIAAKERLGLQQ